MMMMMMMTIKLMRLLIAVVIKLRKLLMPITAMTHFYKYDDGMIVIYNDCYFEKNLK